MIMVSLPTVSSFFSTCGCFLRGGRSPSGDFPPLYLAWDGLLVRMAPSLTNGGASRVLGLKILRVQAKGAEPSPGVGWADRHRPISAQFGRPFAPVGPQVIMHVAPSTCMILTMSSSHPRWMFSEHEVRSFTLQSPGVFLVALRSLPPLEVISSSS
jgi:hypothetical protein